MSSIPIKEEENWKMKTFNQLVKELLVRERLTITEIEFHGNLKMEAKF